MQIFLKLPTDKTLVYISEPTDKIIDVKRYALQKIKEIEKIDVSLVMVYHMYINYNGKILYDDYLVKEHVVKNTTMHLHIRSGYFQKDRTQEFIVSVDINEYKLPRFFSVFCSPDDTIEYLIQYILEKLYLIKKHDLTLNDIAITYNNTYLHPNKHFAEYNQISSSYLKLKQNDNLFENSTIIGDFLHQSPNGYYYMSLGDRKDKKPHLIFRKEHPSISILKKEKNALFLKKNSSCDECDNPYVMVTPCCRNRICTSCMKYILYGHVCHLCGAPN
jgi:hypothetical protein